VIVLHTGYSSMHMAGGVSDRRWHEEWRAI